MSGRRCGGVSRSRRGTSCATACGNDSVPTHCDRTQPTTNEVIARPAGLDPDWLVRVRSCVRSCLQCIHACTGWRSACLGCLPSVCACARVVRMDGDSEGDCPARRRAILCLEKHLGRRSCAVATTAGRPSLRHHFYASVCRRVCRRGEVRCPPGPCGTRHTTYTHANHVHHRLACQRVVHVGPCVPRRMEPEKCEEWAWKKWPAEIPQPRFLPLDTKLRARFLSLE